MAKCLAPTFPGFNALLCIFIIVALSIFLTILILGFTWLTEAGRCLIRQTIFRSKHCQQGNRSAIEI